MPPKIQDRPACNWLVLGAMILFLAGLIVASAQGRTGRGPATSPATAPATAPSAAPDSGDPPVFTGAQIAAIQGMIDLAVGRAATAAGPVAAPTTAPVSTVVAPVSAPALPPVTPIPPPIIGVWYQPAASLRAWRARGVNTLLGYEPQEDAPGHPTVTIDQWCAAAQVVGLRYYLQFRTDAIPHAADPGFAGWLLGDEPNGGGNRTPPQNQADADACRAAAPKPVAVNLDGWKLQWEPDAEIAAYCRAGDVIFADYYILNRGESDIGKLGVMVDRLRRLAAGKPVAVFIECSDQNLRVQEWSQNPDGGGGPPAPRMRAPTADEMRAQVQLVIAHGAAGICYFPQIIGRNFEAYDGAPVSLVAAMVAINAGLGKQ